MADILHMVNIKARPDIVFAALSEKSGLAGWWTESVQAEPRVGTVAKFRFGEAGGSDMKILALEKDRLVRWRCVAHLSADEWVGTELTFELRPERDGTAVRFSHRRWSEATDFLRYCSLRWALYLISLKAFVETGMGNPWPRDVAS
jgi:uncharacterized protein YndB with AHSA1/START domain